MNTKTIILVIILSVLIGFVIFKLTSNKTVHVDQIVTQNFSSNQSPISKPTLPPIDQNSNLEQELDKLTPPDFSEDFKKLREEIKIN